MARKYVWHILVLWFLASIVTLPFADALIQKGAVFGGSAVVLSVIGVVTLPLGIILHTYQRISRWLLSKEYAWLFLWLTFGVALVSLPFAQRFQSGSGMLSTAALILVVLCVIVLPLPALLLTWRFVASRVPVQHRWWLLWVWFGGGVVLLWFEWNSKDDLVGVFVFFSVLAVPVLAAYQTAHRFGISSGELNSRVEWIMERWGWKVLWFGGGAAALLVATSSSVLDRPKFPEGWMLPSLFLFGTVSSASIATLAQEWMGNKIIQRAPVDSLYPGQFMFVMLGIVTLGLIVAALLLVAFGNALALADAMEKRGHPGWETPTAWIAGIVCGLWSLAAAIWVPLEAMFNWFAARRTLDRMKTDALLKLADHLTQAK